ncbi:MAG: hypothetical protein M1834_000775 [Cirrosporium novae-zelandiae]|nr:MAG: hypothetical protein M1834_000775 [Cirrosporium novae-zelandiae]
MVRPKLDVLFKRKPVQYLTRPSGIADVSEVWVIKQTSEVFDDYEKYLHRMDFYKQRRFICEITGHSGLTFFEALASETTGSKEVNAAFPEPLKGPILRRVQFSTISRIDNLVDHIYDSFKKDFFPGEKVTAILANGQHLSGQIREKSSFPELIKPDGTIERKAFVRYFVSLFDQPDKEALVDEEHITRDRKVFTKQMLRSFIKDNVTREAWTGAPWLVKIDAALRHHIDTVVPPELQHKNKLAERKNHSAIKKGEQEGSPFGSFHAGGRYPELKPKGSKSKISQADLDKREQEQMVEYQRALAANPNFALAQQAQHAQQAGFFQQFIPYNGNGHPVPFHTAPPPVRVSPPKPPTPPPVKYPIEDLNIPPDQDRPSRPVLKYLCDGPPVPVEAKIENGGIQMRSVGLLLETWETLNVYCEVFLLDSFTFDDFVEAMAFSSENLDVECELFVEVHCAVLKKLVNGENDQNGQVQVVLPDIVQEDSSDEESVVDSSAIPTPTPEPEVKPVGRTTRSSLAKAEAAKLQAEAAAAASPSPASSADVKVHRAAEMLADYDWVPHLRKRDFKNGGWQAIMVGILYQMSMDPRYRQPCDEILSKLVPLDIEPTQDTVRSQYAELDINLRVKALQIICMLTIDTKAIRGYMEECSSHMTELRKEKIEWQRSRKATIEELRQLHEERKLLQPNEKSLTPPPELKEIKDEDSEMKDPDEEPEVPDTEDEEPHQGRNLRHARNREAERKRREEEEKARKEKAAAKAAQKQSKEEKKFQKVLDKIEKKKAEIKNCEEEIAILDNDLREADCPRIRVLGKDRFWNRYYWLERNAMPYSGLPTSSTADAGYANGCIWIQGPDDMEREGFINVPDVEATQFRQTFKMTVAERKKLEEGSTNVFTACQWGYYDEPGSVDQLINWLDVRGERELKLSKELKLQRDNIVEYMKKRKEYLSREKETDQDEPMTRIQTRGKTYVNPTGHRCFKWHNTTAVNEIGHLHMDQPPRPNKKGKKNGHDGPSTRVTNRQGKPLTRQGGRYDF